ncbi:MAG: hypothetical protein AB1384_10760 [Actinomycetota bacterium]
MIRINAKGLAKYMAASPSTQRRTLRDYKNPDDESRAKIIYYKEARDYIRRFHQDNKDTDWLRQQASILKLVGEQATGQTASRLKNNARALIQYAHYFGNKTYTLLGDLSLPMDIAGVRVICTPDLYVSENDREKLIKLDFLVKEPDIMIPKVICQLLYEAAIATGIDIASSDAIYIDVPRGKMYKKARGGARIVRDIEATCQNIAAIWDSI